MHCSKEKSLKLLRYLAKFYFSEILCWLFYCVFVFKAFEKLPAFDCCPNEHLFWQASELADTGYLSLKAHTSTTQPRSRTSHALSPPILVKRSWKKGGKTVFTIHNLRNFLMKLFHTFLSSGQIPHGLWSNLTNLHFGSPTTYKFTWVTHRNCRGHKGPHIWGAFLSPDSDRVDDDYEKLRHNSAIKPRH